MDPASASSTAAATPGSASGPGEGDAAGAAGATTAAAALSEQLDQLNFGIEKSMRYHQRRIAHYDRLHKWSMFLVVLTGSAAFGEAAVDFVSPKLWGLLAAIIGATDLAFSWSSKARDHQGLYKRFCDAAIALRTAEPSTRLATRLQRMVLEIEADEPPTYWLLEADCDNETRVAWGREKQGLTPLAGWERAIKHFYRSEGLNRPARTKAA